MDDPAPTTSTSYFGPAKLHGENTAAFEADIPDFNLLAGKFLFGGGFDDGRTGFTPKEETGGVRLWIAADQQYAFALLRHHVT